MKMATIEERLAALETIMLSEKLKSMLNSMTDIAHPPSTEKRLEILEETVKRILEMNGKSYDTMMRMNDTAGKIVNRQEALALRVAEHDIIFQKMKEELEKAEKEIGPFRRG
jgi:ABC-type Fe3+-citrate transport system substrate-binding protein